MNDDVLERVWRSRKAISAKCRYDPEKLVKFYQERQKKISKPTKVRGEKPSSAAR